VLVFLQTGARHDDPRRWRFESQAFFLKSAAEMGEAFADLPEALAATLDVASLVDLKIDLGSTQLPPFDCPEGLTPEQYLRRLAEKGLRWRYGDDPPAAAPARPEAASAGGEQPPSAAGAPAGAIAGQVPAASGSDASRPT